MEDLELLQLREILQFLLQVFLYLHLVEEKAEIVLEDQEVPVEVDQEQQEVMQLVEVVMELRDLEELDYHLQ